MPLKITIQRVRDADFFWGGDRISGYVEAEGPLNISNATVKIGFAGSCTTAQTGNPSPDDRSVFVQAWNVLLEGDVNIKDGATQTWAFNFQIPVNTEPSWGYTKIIRSNKPQYATTTHPIPPSIALWGIHRTWMKRAWAAHVLYQLHAKVVQGGRIIQQRVEFLTVMPPPKVLPENSSPNAHLHTQESKMFTYSSSRLLPGRGEHQRSMGEWVHDKISSDVPSVDFRITAQTPKILAAGQDIPIQVTLICDTEKAPLLSLPKVQLVELQYVIRAPTGVVSHRDLQTATLDTVFGRKLRFPSLFLEIGKGFNVGGYIASDGDAGHWAWAAEVVPQLGGTHKVYGQYRGPPRQLALDVVLASSFATYNIYRKYESQITLRLRCGGRRMTARLPWCPLEMVFNESDPHLPTTQLPQANIHQDGAVASLMMVLQIMTIVL